VKYFIVHLYATFYIQFIWETWSRIFAGYSSRESDTVTTQQEQKDTGYK